MVRSASGDEGRNYSDQGHKGPVYITLITQLNSTSTSAVLARPRPSDFHVFGPLKQAMGGRSFRSDEEVQQAVHEWLRSQPKDFFIEASMHFRNAGTLVLHALETT
jgi:hypothetical protein